MNVAATLDARWLRLDLVPEAQYPERMLHHHETRRLFNLARSGALDMNADDIDVSFDPFNLHGDAA